MSNSGNPAAPARPEWLSRLLEEGSPPALPREKMDLWLERNRTNSESLLALSQAGGGQDYLLQALKLYPDDPKVLFASTRLDEPAELKRQRLDRFKTADPDNALAYYLSARQHLKQSEPDQAVADLLAASRLNRFDDYTVQAMQTAEELYLSAGLSQGEAKALGGSSVLLPHLAQLKDLTRTLMDLRGQYIAAGDARSAENLAQYTMSLGDRLMSGEGSRFSINQLVGAAIQQITLNQLDPAQSYDFLGGSVADRKDRITAFRDEIKQENKMVEQWLITADEERVISYFERIKLYGERKAHDWVKNTR